MSFNLFSAVRLFIAAVATWQVIAQSEYRTEDILVPAECESIAGVGDHVLLQYHAYHSNGSLAASLTKPSTLAHVHLTNQEDLPLLQAIKGMCNNATRRIIWDDASKINTLPLFIDAHAGLMGATQGVYIDIQVERITSHEDYQIFSALRQGNYSLVFDLIEQHVGVNAVDEWGHTPLMVAVQTNRMDIVAALLNTRLPKVDMNAAKPSGHTALFYAVEKATVSVVEALLRRGADPNVQLLQPGSRGNTPLHFACLLEKTKAAELLLSYGAVPHAVNEYNQVPLQLLPADAVRSTKLFFKKMFEEALQKVRDAAEHSASGNPAQLAGEVTSGHGSNSGRSDL